MKDGVLVPLSGGSDAMASSGDNDDDEGEVPLLYQSKQRKEQTESTLPPRVLTRANVDNHLAQYCASRDAILGGGWERTTTERGRTMGQK